MRMLAKAKLNRQAQILEDCETVIRIIVRDGVLSNTPHSRISERVRAEINKAIKYITIKDLKDAAVRSLWSFYLRQYSTFKMLYGGDFTTLALLLVLASNKPTQARQAAFNTLKARGAVVVSNVEKITPVGKTLYVPKMYVNIYGVPTQTYMRDYMRDKVKPVLDRLCNDYAKDPDDIDGQNSLRNRAEMEVRYNGHLQQIAELKASGARLVIASTHADCSKRCAPWQGRVYSLDGTSGTTPDGRKYIPLEEATDVWYTTKVGKRYKNGLLGFNCRHYLVEYKDGYQFPEPNAKEERRQYEITKKQRAYERQVRKWETRAFTTKGIDDEGYKEAKAKAKQWRSEYIKYSHDNGRAYYPSRINIL